MSDSQSRPTEDPGEVEHCTVCGSERSKQRFPGCYWGKFSQSWTCVRDNPLLGRGA